MRWRRGALFLSGLFFGGAVDHVLLALKRSAVTPYGVRAGVRGNWVLAALDGGLATLCYALYRRSARWHDEAPGVAERGRYIPALRFAWLTGVYDSVLRVTMRESTIKSALLAVAHIGADQQVLDLGCGTGTLMLLVKQARPSARVVGIDGDPAVLRIARAKAARAGVELSFDEGMVFDLPYPDGSFDRVLASLVLHHLTRADKLRALREAHRVLRPAGELHVADFGRPQDALMAAVSMVTRFFEETQDHIAGRLPALMRAAGFDAVQDSARYRTVRGTIALYAARRRV